MRRCAPFARVETGQRRTRLGGAGERTRPWGGQEQSCELLLSPVPHASTLSSLQCLTDGPYFTDEETGAQKG